MQIPITQNLKRRAEDKNTDKKKEFIQMTNITSETIVTINLDDEVVDKQRRKGLFSRFRRRWGSSRASTVALQKNDSFDETVRTTNETDSDSVSISPLSAYDHSDPLGATYESIPDNILHSLLKLLSSESLGLNRVGLQRLNLLINGRGTSDSYKSKEIAPYVLVLGGPLGSMEELLRFFFVTMICDAPQNVHCHRVKRHAEMKRSIQRRLSQEEEAVVDWVLKYDASTSKGAAIIVSGEDNDLTSLSNYSNDSERVVRHSQGKSDGVLHNHALKIFTIALGKIYAENPNALTEIDLGCSLWRSILTSLVENIEMNHNINATVYSMKILRVLSLVHSKMIVPLLQYNLFPILVDLKEYGEKQRLPLVTKEASILLNLAQRQ